jgi:hypothetical protein
MSITLSALQRQRRDTAANWTAENPTLLAGEIGLESDTGYWKVGDGATAWNALAYVPGLGAEIPVSRLADGSARQLLQTDAAGTGVEWASNIDVPGTLDVTGAATFDNNVTIQGDLTVNGTTTTIDTQNLIVEDKNVIIGNVTTPTDVTADGGGITLKGTTDKTINWIDATDAWTLSEHVNIASAKEYRIAGTKVLDATSLGSAVVSSSLTSVGTISSGTWQGTAINAAYLPAGTTSAVGIVQLTDSTSSTSTTTAATPNSVKSAYDLANAALPKAGGTLTGNVDNTSTGYFDLPAGTTAQRPGTANSGMIRFNIDLTQFEGYNGSAWGTIGGGATGGGSDRVFYENDQVVTTNYTLTSNKNAMTAGPVTINAGVAVTVPSGANWVVV